MHIYCIQRFIISICFIFNNSFYYEMQSNDRAFKDELGKLVDLSVWEAAKESSKQEVAQR